MCYVSKQVDDHCEQLGNDDAREEAIERKTQMVRSDLLCGSTLWIGKDEYNILGFSSDVELSCSDIAKFVYGRDSDLKKSIDDQLDVYCGKIAVRLIDNMEREV